MTIKELIWECLQLGLDGEKVDYEWERNGEKSVVLGFEDGHKIRVTLEDLGDDGLPREGEGVSG